MQGRVEEERNSLAERCTAATALRLLFSDAGTKQSKDGWLPTQRSGIAAEQLIEVRLNGVSKECLVMTTTAGGRPGHLTIEARVVASVGPEATA